MSTSTTSTTSTIGRPAPPTVPTAPRKADLLVRVLADRAGLQVDIVQEDQAAALVPGLVTITALGAAVYGVAIGLPAGPAQVLAGAIKLPIVLLGAAAISMPVLHVATALTGKRLRFQQLSALVLQALATATVTMAGLAPIVTVWWLTVSAHACTFCEAPDGWFVYRRVVLAAVAVAAIGGSLGAARLLRAIPLRAALPWTAAFALAGLQLTWLVRPVVGMPDGDFVLLRPLESNALTELLTALAAVLG